ncbi:MAG: DUF72 domain-containing protein [Longimicrobiales bacterium]
MRVGTAGWLYDDWKGIVYPKPAPRRFDPLPYLARYFDTIEINSTFYHAPASKTAQNWAKRVESAPDFRFTAKLWRRFTHDRDATWNRNEVKKVKDGFRPLLDAGRLGAVLLQFPWSFRRTDENREWLGDLTDTFAAFPLVLEVRHVSWNLPEFYRELAEREVGFVNIDQPLFRNSIKPSGTTTHRIGYIRLHGRNYQDWFREGAGRDARYDYLYTPRELETWKERVDEVARDAETDEVYVVTNNHYKGQAAVNALQLKAMIEGEAPLSPPPLFTAYEDSLEGFAQPDPEPPQSAKQ